MALTMLCSLDNNALCGVVWNRTFRTFDGTYTSEGITALCEGLKQSNVTSLRCGACLLNMRDIGCYRTFDTDYWLVIRQPCWQRFACGRVEAACCSPQGHSDLEPQVSSPIAQIRHVVR